MIEIKTAWQYVHEEYHKIEYEIVGMAWETEKFTPIENVYDLEK